MRVYVEVEGLQHAGDLSLLVPECDSTIAARPSRCPPARRERRSDWRRGLSGEEELVHRLPPALPHLAPLRLRNTDGHIVTTGTQAVGEPRLHLLGYGDWTGPASAILIGVGRLARDMVDAVQNMLRR